MYLFYEKKRIFLTEILRIKKKKNIYIYIYIYIYSFHNKQNFYNYSITNEKEKLHQR